MVVGQETFKYDPGYPKKPAVEDIDPEDTVEIDLGITKFIHDSANRSFESLDEGRDRDRIDRRHRDLSRKEYGSNNWENARQQLARAYERLQNRREDYREKLAHEYTTQYDAVFLEDLDVNAMKEDNGNSRTVATNHSGVQATWEEKRLSRHRGPARRHDETLFTVWVCTGETAVGA